MICAYNEPTATSTHAYSVGDYFIYNDVLYRATAIIGVGDTIVPDTNCTSTNVTTEIASAVGDIDDFKYNNPITNISSAYDSTSTYAFGDIVSFIDSSHIGKIYKCATAINTPETFTPAHWTEVNVDGLYAKHSRVVATANVTNATTYTDFLNDLYSQFTIDKSKNYVLFRISNTSTEVFYAEIIEAAISFTRTTIRASNLVIYALNLGSASTAYVAQYDGTNWTFINRSTSTDSGCTYMLIEYNR